MKLAFRNLKWCSHDRHKKSVQTLTVLPYLTLLIDVWIWNLIICFIILELGFFLWSWRKFEFWLRYIKLRASSLLKINILNCWSKRIIPFLCWIVARSLKHRTWGIGTRWKGAITILRRIHHQQIGWSFQFRLIFSLFEADDVRDGLQNFLLSFMR